MESLGLNLAELFINKSIHFTKKAEQNLKIFENNQAVSDHKIVVLVEHNQNHQKNPTLYKLSKGEINFDIWEVKNFKRMEKKDQKSLIQIYERLMEKVIMGLQHKEKEDMLKFKEQSYNKRKRILNHLHNKRINSSRSKEF